jgi:hypothetical protein
MMPKAIAETAFRLHEKKCISREELVRILQQCVNATVLENSYADQYGLPFPLGATEEVPSAA